MLQSLISLATAFFAALQVLLNPAMSTAVENPTIEVGGKTWHFNKTEREPNYAVSFFLPKGQQYGAASEGITLHDLQDAQGTPVEAVKGAMDYVNAQGIARFTEGFSLKGGEEALYTYVQVGTEADNLPRFMMIKVAKRAEGDGLVMVQYVKLLDTSKDLYGDFQKLRDIWSEKLANTDADVARNWFGASKTALVD